MNDEPETSISRRRLLSMIGMTAGSTAMYQAMHSLGFAAESSFRDPVQLSAAPKGASVLVLGAGIAGLVAAYELRNAGYRVQVLEYNARAGGRNWTLRGGDRYTELGGDTQECRFDPGHYINPGPWRLPYHHRGMLSYCKRLGVALEPFVQINYNAYLHSRKAFGGKPQRLRAVKADYHGHVAELLTKATRNDSLDADVTAEDREKLLDSLLLRANARLTRQCATRCSRLLRKTILRETTRRYVALPSRPLAITLVQSLLWIPLLAGSIRW